MATTNNKFRSYLHQRNPQGNKYTSGRLLVDAGSTRFPGAAVLTVGGARRGGAGYISYLSRENLPTELVLRAYPDVVPVTSCESEQVDAIVIGPGSPNIALIPRISRMIIDGGALALISQPAPDDQLWILTPHEGEISRMGFDPSNRESCALKAAQELNAIVLLKGRHSIVATPAGISFIDQVGGTELSTAGTGDVLAGLIGSMIAAHRPTLLREAAEVVAHSVEIFAAAAHSSMRTRTPLVATDVMEEIPRLLAQEGTSL